MQMYYFGFLPPRKYTVNKISFEIIVKKPALYKLNIVYFGHLCFLLVKNTKDNRIKPTPFLLSKY